MIVMARPDRRFLHLFWPYGVLVSWVAIAGLYLVALIQGNVTGFWPIVTWTAGCAFVMSVTSTVTKAFVIGSPGRQYFRKVDDAEGTATQYRRLCQAGFKTRADEYWRIAAMLSAEGNYVGLRTVNDAVDTVCKIAAGTSVRADDARLLIQDLETLRAELEKPKGDL